MRHPVFIQILCRYKARKLVKHVKTWEHKKSVCLLSRMRTHNSRRKTKKRWFGTPRWQWSHTGDMITNTVYPKKYANGFFFAVLCCGYTLTDFPLSIRLTSLALWQSNDCPSASKATLMNMDKYFMCIHYGRLHNHNKAKHNKTVCIFLGIYCSC